VLLLFDLPATGLPPDIQQCRHRMFLADVAPVEKWFQLFRAGPADCVLLRKEPHRFTTGLNSLGLWAPPAPC